MDSLIMSAKGFWIVFLQDHIWMNTCSCKLFDHLKKIIDALFLADAWVCEDAFLVTFDLILFCCKWLRTIKSKSSGGISSIFRRMAFKASIPRTDDLHLKVVK
jgi:hypothetical protein